MKNIKKWIAIFIILAFALCGCEAQEAQTEQENSNRQTEKTPITSYSTDESTDNSPVTLPEDTKDITVYVTKTGEKYHRSGCQYLSKSKIAMDLSEAAESYSPCSKCNPPTP